MRQTAYRHCCYTEIIRQFSPHSGYLEDKFNSKDAGENKVEVVENDVAVRLLVNWIFSSQSDAACADDYHYKQIEVAKVDNKVAETTNSTYRRQNVTLCLYTPQRHYTALHAKYHIAMQVNSTLLSCENRWRLAILTCQKINKNN